LTGPQQSVREKYVSCLTERVREGSLNKGSPINPYRLKLLCGGDIRTATEHLPGLKGANVGGTLQPLDVESGPWIIVDPPEDQEWLVTMETSSVNDHACVVHGQSKPTKTSETTCHAISEFLTRPKPANNFCDAISKFLREPSKLE
jgi:hypothetical protein